MAIPVLLWGAAAVLAATGVVKGAAAMSDLDDAKDMGERAERRYKRKNRELDNIRNETNQKLAELGALKVEIFGNQIKHILQVIKNSSNKNAKSSLKDFNTTFSIEEIKQMEKMVEHSLELGTNLASSATAGILTGIGVYGSIPLIATASTGTAISTLSGVAATNATLAWLGGGSLAAGGLGMTGGMLALGGIVIGPALAVGGFMLANQAEEALTKARAYKAEVAEAVAQIDLVIEGIKGLQENTAEVRYTLEQMVQRFEEVRVDSVDEPNFQAMLLIGKALKELMDIRIIEEDGSPIPHIKEQCSGYLEIKV